MAFYSLHERYKFARFQYECLFASSESGKTCFDPVFYHYPNLTMAYDDIESTFIVNDAIKVSPVLESIDMVANPNATFSVYFPPGKWVDMDTFEVVDVKNETGEMVNLKPEVTVKKHLRPGHMVPVQYNATKYANNTAQLAHTDINLFINRDEDRSAVGKLFLDKGENISELTKKEYEYYEFELVN